MIQKHALTLRDTLVALTPRFPEALTISEMQLRLRAQRQLDVDLPQIAYFMKKAVKQRYIAFLGPRKYTRPMNPTEFKQARSWVKPGPRFRIHKPTPGLSAQLKALNAAYVSAFKDEFKNKFLRSSQNPLTTT
jgi:hypothetical protein